MPGRLAKLQSLKSDIAASERQMLASGLQVGKARIKLEQTVKAEANAIAQLGRATAEQLQTEVVTSYRPVPRDWQTILYPSSNPDSEKGKGK